MQWHIHQSLKMTSFNRFLWNTTLNIWGNFIFHRAFTYERKHDPRILAFLLTGWIALFYNCTISPFFFSIKSSILTSVATQTIPSNVSSNISVKKITYYILTLRSKLVQSTCIGWKPNDFLCVATFQERNTECKGYRQLNEKTKSKPRVTLN